MSYTSPLSLLLLRLQRFLNNRKPEDGTALDTPFHSLGLKKVIISAGIPPCLHYPHAVIQPPRESEDGLSIGLRLSITLIDDRVREDDGLLKLLDLSNNLRDVLARHWDRVGGPWKLDTQRQMLESEPFLAPGGVFENQAVPPVQGIRISIPLRSVTAR